jgi:hypothetical protein
MEEEDTNWSKYSEVEEIGGSVYDNINFNNIELVSQLNIVKENESDWNMDFFENGNDSTESFEEKDMTETSQSMYNFGNTEQNIDPMNIVLQLNKNATPSHNGFASNSITSSAKKQALAKKPSKGTLPTTNTFNDDSKAISNKIFTKKTSINKSNQSNQIVSMNNVNGNSTNGVRRLKRKADEGENTANSPFETSSPLVSPKNKTERSSNLSSNISPNISSNSLYPQMASEILINCINELKQTNSQSSSQKGGKLIVIDGYKFV